jgi:uncharacterized protein (DUF169 family)
MDVTEAVATIRDGLEIDREPVAVKYTDEEPDAGVETGYPVCQALLHAAEDDAVIELSCEGCPCPGGRAHLGLSDRNEVSRESLVEGEKLWHDLSVAYRSGEQSDDLAEPPVGLADTVYLYPATEDVFDPDLVVFLVDAEQASRIVFLNQYWDGVSPSMEMHGSMCWSVITYPFVSGQVNVSAGEVSARDLGEWPSHLLTVTVPAENVDDVAAAVPESTAGTADRAEEFQRMMDGMRQA